MKQLNHTLFVTENDIELCLRGEALEAKQNGNIISHIPLHNLDGIITCSYYPASPALMATCAEKGIDFIVLSNSGKLKYRICGKTSGNPILRILQYEKYKNEIESLEISKVIIEGKIKNCIALVRKHGENHTESHAILYKAINNLENQLLSTPNCHDSDSLRGTEGVAARIYFDTFSTIIRSIDSEMQFNCRTLRPPENPCNALLSFSYVMLTNLCISALESVGLDPYIGFLHSVKSGKPSLALDLMEELRPVIADRFVIRMINLSIMKNNDFEYTDDGISLTKTGLKKYFTEWNKMRSRTISVTGCDEKIPLGLMPFFQAQKLSRFIYGKDSSYCPYSLNAI